MKILDEEVLKFFRRQSFVIVSTVTKNESPHNACKGIIEIDDDDCVYLMDLYMGKTYENLRNNPHISITAVDEHKFKGYSLSGNAQILSQEQIKPELVAAWEERISSRITQRVLKNMQGQKGHPSHPESMLPSPKYMILMKVMEIINLTPHHLSKAFSST